MKNSLNKSQIERYSRQIILKNVGAFGQKKIINSKVLIIGMGGLGCPLLTYLAASGVGTLGIADHDKVELSNLNRQTLFNTGDIGKFKVDQAKKKIFKLKERPKFNPLIIHYHSLKDAHRDVFMNKYFKQLYKQFCPGPLTFVLNRKKTFLQQ